MDDEDTPACGSHTGSHLSAPLPRGAVPRIDIGGERRRAHNAAFRAGMLAEAAGAGVRVQHVARRHGISASLVYSWRRAASLQAGAGSAMQLVPVLVADPRAESPLTAPSRRPGLIEIKLARGVRVCVDPIRI